MELLEELLVEVEAAVVVTVVVVVALAVVVVVYLKSLTKISKTKQKREHI